MTAPRSRPRLIRATALFAAAALLGAPAAWAQEAKPSLAEILSEADDDPEAAGRLERQISAQQRMLRQLQGGEVVDESDLLAPTSTGPAPGDNDLRVAPAAPVDRPLPIAIFEAAEVRVERGRWGNNRRMDLLKRVLDADGDGHPELVRYVEPDGGDMVRQEEDRNFDGVTDAWSDYRDGVLVARTLDSNDDGSPDVWEEYGDGRMTRREVDRDDDGVRDATYEYRAGSLVEERHDANNDGRVDLHITYRDRRRARAEEDHDKDGRVDTWRIYSAGDGEELVTRVERDKKGRGFADTFETFEAVDGRAVLSLREEDVDGDGEVDVTSHYESGKLRRREILRPELLPM